MKALLIFVALTISLTSQAEDFNYSSYKNTPLAEILEESKLYDPEKKEGQSILMPSPKIHLFEMLSMFPKKCDTFLPIFVLNTIGIPTGSLPPINYCMSIKTEDNVYVNLYIQDSIAGFVAEEYKLGDKIHLNVMWLFVNSSDKKPYFLVNGLGE